MVSLKKVAKMSHMSTERDGTGWDLRPGGMGFFFLVHNGQSDRALTIQ